MSKEFENLKWYLQAKGQDKSDGYLVNFNMLEGYEREGAFTLLADASENDSYAIPALAELDPIKSVPILKKILQTEETKEKPGYEKMVNAAGELWLITGELIFSEKLGRFIDNPSNNVSKSALQYLEKKPSESKNVMKVLRFVVLEDENPIMQFWAARIIVMTHKIFGGKPLLKDSEKKFLKLLGNEWSNEDRLLGISLLDKEFPIV